MVILEVVIVGLLGLCMGSFLNVVADRLSNDIPITGRSQCGYCHKTLKWYELVPVVSFFVQGGKCRSCRKKLSWYYPLSEIMTALLFVAAWIFFPVDFFREVYPNTIPVLYIAQQGLEGSLNVTADGVQFYLLKVLFLGVVSCTVAIILADLKYFIIPDEVQIAFAFFAIAILAIGTPLVEDAGMHIFAAFLIMLPMLAIYLGTSGNGLGFGDVKLAANMGLFLGVKGGLIALYWAFILGTVVGVLAMIVQKKGMKSKIPFGPFLVLGMWITWWNATYWFYLLRYYFNW